jgi:hypothetical protein
MDSELLSIRRIGLTASMRTALKEFQEAEIYLDESSMLLEIAEDIRTAQVNADLKNIEC